MSILYRIYANNGTGGPVDFSTPVGSTATLSFGVGPLAAPGDYRFAVRAFDTATGIEEANTQVYVDLRLDPSGLVLRARPNPVHALIARPTAAGGCRIDWAYSPAGQAASPVDFLATLSAAGLAPVSATVNYRPGTSNYSCSFAGGTAEAIDTVTVLARTSGGDAGNAISTTVRTDSTPPDDVDGLTATASS